MVKATFIGFPTKPGMQRQINDEVREEMRAMGQAWKERYLPKHFTRAGAREYAYKDRTKGYMMKKARKQGHQDPLVYSGESRARALGAGNIVATAIAKKASVAVSVNANTLNFRAAGKGGIDLYNEVIAVADGELNALRDGLQTGFALRAARFDWK